MYLVLLLSLSYAVSDASRILVCVPSPSISHQVTFYPLIKELLKRGHEVVFITTDAMYLKGKTPANLTEIDTHNLSYKVWAQEVQDGKRTRGSKEDQYGQVSKAFEVIAKSFEQQVLTPEMQDLIHKKTHFDLLIIEACAKSALSLSHVFNAPVILMSSFGSHQDNYDLVGAPKYPKLLYPYCMHQKLNNMTIVDKIKVLWDVYNIEAMFSRLRVKENRIVKRLFGPDASTLEELGDNVHMLFLNVYPIWESNRPVPPSVVFIGGIHQKLQNELPKDLQTFLDSSKRGVVYFSFGTNVSPSVLHPKKVQVIKGALSRLPYEVLVKWDKDELPGVANNVRAAKWLPQSDLLRHPNIKAFITQGGLQSFDEALTGGVPIVGIPMLGDQWYNVEMFVKLKIGVGLLIEEITEDELMDAVNTVINDSSYKRNMIALRDKLRDEPQSALDRAVWWTEHVIRHKGAGHLRSSGANISWAEYLDVELMAVLGLLVLWILAVSATTLYFLGQFAKRKLAPVKLKDA